MIRNILIMFGFIFFSSCSQSTPFGIIERKKMQDVLWDMAKADALAQQIAIKDSTKKLPYETVRLTNEVFILHKISPKEFDKSYAYYVSHPDIISIMLDSINAQQNRKINMPVINISKPHADSLIKNNLLK